MKKGIRILAIDDSPYKKGDASSLIIGVIGRERTIEGVLSSKVAVDGSDSAQRIIKMLKSSRFPGQVALLALNGITVAGLNLVNIVELNKRLEIPIMAVTRKKPRPAELAKAMKKWSPEYDEKARIMKDIRKNIVVERVGGYYVQSIGMDSASVQMFIEKAAELLRLSHLIASGVVRGESKGRL